MRNCTEDEGGPLGADLTTFSLLQRKHLSDSLLDESLINTNKISHTRLAGFNTARNLMRINHAFLFSFYLSINSRAPL
jgi:hypothetical protein